MTDLHTHEPHDHIRHETCGHNHDQHHGHTNFLHEGHLHHPHDDHIDKHNLPITQQNPQHCTHMPVQGMSPHTSMVHHADTYLLTYLKLGSDSN